MTRISQAVIDLREKVETQSITIRAQSTLISNFLIPSLSSPEANTLELNIEFQSRRNEDPINFDGPGIAILYGSGTWKNYKSERILDDQMFPICSASTRNKYPDLNDIKILEKETLLQLSSYIDPAMSWEYWADKLKLDNLKSKSRRNFDDYEMLLKACETGSGIAIGCLCVVAQALKSGVFYRLTTRVHTTKNGYYLVYDPLLLESGSFQNLINFLKNSAVQFSSEYVKGLELE